MTRALRLFEFALLVAIGLAIGWLAVLVFG